MPSLASPFGELLRDWRRLRGFSQLDLALVAQVSTRHLSFLETGRSQASRTMVLTLAEALEMPLRDCNALLLAAGYAPAFPEQPLDAPQMTSVRSALQLVLQSHEPYPAFVLDRSWNMLLSNAAHDRLLDWMLPAGADRSAARNVMRLVFDESLLRPRLRNWQEVAGVLEKRLRRALQVPEPAPQLQQLYDDILAMPGVRQIADKRLPPKQVDVLIPMQFEFQGQLMSWFSMIATIGTAQDITLEELQLESLFPADEATEQVARELAHPS